jgi:uncharacterized protein
MKKITFPCEDFFLEGVLSVPEGKGPFGLVIVCHPHPLYGGSMHSKVVYAVCNKIGEKGLAWLKFNFRGVENSGGRFSQGEGEKEDLRAAISFGAGHERIDPANIGLCGYSFGSMIALAVAAQDPRGKAVAAISPLLEAPDLLERPTIPRLFVAGTVDEFVDSKELELRVLKLPEPKELVIYSGEDHFWNRYEEPMSERVADFFVHELIS